MILGVTGFFASGKDSVAGILMRKGFQHVSLSDMIREEIRRRGEEVTIPRLTQVGNELRAQFGPQVLAERALNHLTGVSQAVVTSIRHSGEVEALRVRPDFTMVFVDAPIRVRYERSLDRARQGDPVTFEEFAAAEAQQMRNGDPNSQQLQACREMADSILLNDGPLETLEERLDGLLAQLEQH
jgi:dephospho-CoA kinase